MLRFSSVFISLFLCSFISNVYCNYQVTVQDAVVQNGNLVSLNINFGTPVNTFSLGQLQIWSTSQLSLTGASLTKQNNSFYSLSGLSIPTGVNYTLKIVNKPPPIGCSTMPYNMTGNLILVGNGTAASCTESALRAAINQSNQNFGGFINFSCGPNLVSIKLTKPIEITAKNVYPSVTTYVNLNGNGLVELDGQGLNRILNITGVWWTTQNPIVTIQGIRFVNGKSLDVANTTAVNHSGGAIYGAGMSLTVIDCDFYQNNGPATGQDTGGGAIYVQGLDVVKIFGSVFWGNQASDGGAVGVLYPQLSISGSAFLGNSATGYNGNPGQGGNGGAVCVDGKGNNVTICGSLFAYNQAHQYGGGMFRVGYNYSDAVSITKSAFIANNQTIPTGFAGAMYIQGPMQFYLSDSSVSYNNAEGYFGALFMDTILAQITDVTFANNTARLDGSGSAITTANTQGTFSSLTVAYNYAGFYGTLNGNANITLQNSVIANNSEGKGYDPLSCNALFVEGGGNYQWPMTRPNGAADVNCTVNIMKQDPSLNPIDPLNIGCVGPKITFQSGSSASGSGAQCANVPTFQPLTFWSDNYRPIDRLIWFQFSVKSTSVSWGASSQQSGSPPPSSNTNTGTYQTVSIYSYFLLVLSLIFVL